MTRRAWAAFAAASIIWGVPYLFIKIAVDHGVTAPDLADQAQRWPRFANAALQAGFRTVEALPMRLRDQVIGALNLFAAAPGPFDQADVRIGQALADVATISLLHERSMRHSDTLNEQLQIALNSRVIIEQANGKLAERTA